MSTAPASRRIAATLVEHLQLRRTAAKDAPQVVSCDLVHARDVCRDVFRLGDDRQHALEHRMIRPETARDRELDPHYATRSAYSG
jgi:hypothetical protein